MVEPENVFKLANLDTNKPGKYLLSVYQPMPFGVGKNVFMVDEVRRSKETVEGIRYSDVSLWKEFWTRTPSEEVVVRFPVSFQYILINRDQYEVISMEEAKKQIEEMEKEDAPHNHDAPVGIPSQAYL